jgi:hypothetical protein
MIGKGTAKMDINEILEIHVKYPEESGLDDVIYRGKGLEKFRRLIISSPAYGECAGPTVVEECSYDEDRSSVRSESSKKGKKTKSKVPATANGYIQTDLNYSQATKGKSAMDLAREMQKQAESAAGFKF